MILSKFNFDNKNSSAFIPDPIGDPEALEKTGFRLKDLLTGRQAAGLTDISIEVELRYLIKV